MEGDLTPVRDLVKASSIIRKKWGTCRGDTFCQLISKLIVHKLKIPHLIALRWGKRNLLS